MAYTNDIVSTFSYLIGVDKKYFRSENLENTFASIEKYSKLEYSKPGKIVRKRCPHMVEEVPCYNETSHKMTHMTFAAMVDIIIRYRQSQKMVQDLTIVYLCC